MLRFHLGLVLNASTRQGDFKELYGVSLAFILTRNRENNPVRRFRVKDSYNYIVYRKYCNLVQFSVNILCAPTLLSITVPGVPPGKKIQ